MQYIDEFRDSHIAREIAARICSEATRPIKLMEICGTHTMAIARHGIKALLPETVTLISGPGCPVCVTPQVEIDRFIALGKIPDVTLTSFGDMLRVPGSTTTLEIERAKGADVRVVYSPLDAVELAQSSPTRRIVFCGVGFETTTPAVALAITEAKRLNVQNFFVHSAHKIMPPALTALASDAEIAIDGYICPGHVSAILGTDTYQPIARDFGIACVITGFEPLDMLQAIFMLVWQVMSGKPIVEIQYSRVVTAAGNQAAMACANEVFTPVDAEWRGLGVFPASGLRIRDTYAAHDAAQFLPEMPTTSAIPSICECGQILKGKQAPSACRAFGTACTPAHPLGPCMVSSEGACAAEYRYGTLH